MKKKIIFAVLAILVLGLVFSASIYMNDPNLILKKLTKKITLDETQDVSFDYSKRNILRKNYIPVFVFTAPEDGDYSFDITDINTEKDVHITMTVSDEDLNEYFTADNFEEHNGDVGGTEHFAEGSKCIIITDAISENETEDRYMGSFKITVSKAVESQQAELTVDEAVTISLENNEISSVLFRPLETGLYRFDTSIVSGKKKENGFSSVSSVKTDDKQEIKVTEGICHMEEGKDYYIWVTASELTSKKADVSVSCTKVDVIETDSPGSFKISKETVISFKPKKEGNYAIYSISDGNVKGAVYDDKGFPINKDNNSGGTLSENDKDFALVLQATNNVEYLIHADGKFEDCTIYIAVYKGDGSSLGPDDIELPDPAGEDAAASGDDASASDD